jgi:4-hydroxy-tetrahydrodipicolinate reductase
MVEGTTGWYGDIDEVRAIVESSGMGFVYAANFSIGANLLIKLTGEAAKLFDRFEDYDPYVYEHHHRGKVDAPSGTALRLGETILASMERKSRMQIGNPEGRISTGDLNVSSLRAGTAFGQHKVGFDSTADSLELTLTARSREGLARGTLFAAEWIKDKKGFFEFSECLGF